MNTMKMINPTTNRKTGASFALFVAWAAAIVPLAWGIIMTMKKAALLFGIQF